MDDPTSEVQYTPSRSSTRAVYFTRLHLQNTWVYDPELFTKFFPVDDDIRDTYMRFKRGLHSGKRWSRISEKPSSVSQLYTALTQLVNNILAAFGLMYDSERNRRLSINTSKTRVYPKWDYPIWPPLLLTGSGKHFLSAKTLDPHKHYASGISVLEVRLEDEDATVARDRLATHMQQLMSYHHNRRYAFGVVISQQTLTIHMFDRSGVVSSPSLDYHADAEQFCAIIAGLASHDPQRLGFDTSMHITESGGIVRTRKSVGRKKSTVIDYTLSSLIYYGFDLIGRGTICFSAYEKSKPEKQYVIKDSWINPGPLEGKESEASLISHARKRGVPNGIPLVHHTEEISIKEPGGRIRLDTVLNNRQADAAANAKFERIHTRIIISPFGKPLHKFADKEEFLFAYRDALQAHRNLHETGGILHRDIKPGNILINTHGAVGDRGVLIDFDHAIRTDDTSSYSTKRKIGTYFFMSRNALEGSRPHVYLDDLESFYYTMVFVVQTYTAPGRLKERRDAILDEWETSMASELKEGYMVGTYPLRVEPWWGIPFQTLLTRLHSVFKDMLRNRVIAEMRKMPPPVVDDAEVYKTFLSHVDQAIHDISLEAETKGMASPGPHPWDVPSPKRSTNRKRIHAEIESAAVASRPRRKGVEYGAIVKPGNKTNILKKSRYPT